MEIEIHLGNNLKTDEKYKERREHNEHVVQKSKEQKYRCLYVLTVLPMQPYRFYHISSFSTTCSLFIKKKMPPKKAVVEKKTLLGRPSNNLKIGIVGLFWSLDHFFITHPTCLGLPNVGKSSFFNVLSETGIHSYKFSC